jgi:PPP family 3-phenylpropionic acid transporter
MHRSGPPPRAVRLSLFYAASFFLSGIQLPFWPLWLAGRGLGAREIGLLFAAAIWASVIATPAIGALSDRLRGRRGLMSALAAIAFCGYLAMAPAAGFWPLFSLNLVAAAAQSALMPLGDSTTLAAVRGGGLDYGRIRLWGSFAFILAAFATGEIAAAAPGRVLSLMLFASALHLAACLALPPPVPVAPTRPMPPTGLRQVARDRRFWLFAATAAALQASHQLYYGFGTLYWHKLGFSGAAIGLLWAEGVVAEIVLFWQGRRLLARLGPVGLLALGGSAGVVRWICTGFAQAPASIIALQWLHAFTFGASHLGAMHYLSRTVPPTAAASAQALYAALSAGLGSGLVMLVAGALYGRYGGGAYLAMAALSGLGLCGAVGLGRLKSG